MARKKFKNALAEQMVKEVFFKEKMDYGVDILLLVLKIVANRKRNMFMEKVKPMCLLN